MILPTGGGKSLVYQLPSMIMNGITIVVSPLIALMQDQVSALKAQNITAEMLSSAQTFQECDEIMDMAYNGVLKFLYLSPERLNNGQTLDFLHALNINFFVIDEAHCISQWGHEFRDDYCALGRLQLNFLETTRAGITATSTDNVTTDILRELRLHNPLLLKGKVFRKNIFISAERRIGNGQAQLKNFLLRHQDESGIIYVSSRKKAEELSTFLNLNGHKSLAYHAGLPQHVREQNFKIFVNDNVNIMVATIAFGMGIDKSDIRFVVHMSLPKSQENYYQEIGRAGRDGEDSETLLLFNAADAVMQRRFLNDIEDETYKNHLDAKIDGIYKFSTSEICYHKQLAEYFDDTLRNSIKASKETGFTSLGMIPKIILDPRGINLPFIQKRVIEMITQNILQFFGTKNIKEKPKTIIVFSTQKSEGKTVLAGNIAKILKQDGKSVLLLNYDRKPTTIKIMANPKRVAKTIIQPVVPFFLFECFKFSINTVDYKIAK